MCICSYVGSYIILCVTFTFVDNDASNTFTVTTASIATNVSASADTTTTPSASFDDKSSSVLDVTLVVVVVVVIVVFITIIIVVVGTSVVWERKKSEQHTKQEAVYYSTINETTIKRSETSKPEPIYSEINDKQNNKELQYMDTFQGSR